ncbi:MAG: hypothetical protein ACUVS3_07430 [Thermodesulfobacteriota bacterium]
MNVGDELDCHCPRCRLVLTHVILHFEADGSIGAVQCRTCGAKHPLKGALSSRVRNPPPSPKTLKPLLEGGSYQERLSRMARQELVRYNPEGRYGENQAIEHSHFGVGFVLQSKEDRIEVLFQNGIKVLVQGRKPG